MIATAATIASAAKFQAVIIGGKTYKLRPLERGFYAEMASFILSRRNDPLELAVVAMKTLPAECHEMLWKAAIHEAATANVIAAEEVAAFEKSLDGLIWKVWKCLRVDHPELATFHDVQELIAKADNPTVDLLIDAVQID